MVITYSTEDEPGDWTMAQGINTYIFDATDLDLKHLDCVDQTWFINCVTSSLESTRNSGLYVAHHLGVSIDDFEDNTDTQTEPPALEKKDLGKWLKYREAGINNCKDVEKYFVVDMSRARVVFA